MISEQGKQKSLWAMAAPLTARKKIVNALLLIGIFAAIVFNIYCCAVGGIGNL